MTFTIDRNTRHRLKREQILGQQAKRTMAINGDLLSSKEFFILGTPSNSMNEDTVMKADITAIAKEEETSQQFKRIHHHTTFARRVEHAVVDLIDEDIVYGRITGLAYSEININAEIIVCNNLPQHDRSNGCFDLVKQDTAYFSADQVGRIVEYNMDNLVADLVDAAMINSGISDESGILDFISEAITSSMKEKIAEVVEDAVLKIVAQAFCDVLPRDSLIGNDNLRRMLIQESKTVTVRIVDIISLDVDDILTGAIVDASKNVVSVDELDGMTDKVAHMVI